MVKYMFHSESDSMFIVLSEEEYQEALDADCVEVDYEEYEQYKEDLRGL